MAVRRPGVEVVQEFQEAAAALNLPNLPAIVVGPGFQIVEDAEAGTYEEGLSAPVEFEYPNLYTGAVVDLSSEPDDESDANAHMPVTVKLSDALLIQKSTATTGSVTSGDTTFNDPTTNAFSGFDPDASGASTYWVDVISGSGLPAADLKRHFVVSKTDDNNLVLAGEFGATASDVEYRILVELASETIDNADFGDRGISADADGVSIDPGLESEDGLLVVEADILLSWRAIRPDLSGALNVFTDNDSIEAVFGVGTVVPANIGAYAVNLAIQNTTTEVSFTGLGADFFTNEEQAFQDALEYLEDKDVYALAILTHNTSVHQTAKSHVENSSVSTVGRERVCFINRKLTSTSTVVPASGIGTVTSAGTGNGTSGTDNKTFRDPDNGQYITDDVNVGHYLEISSYAATEGVQRSVTPNEADFLEDASGNGQRIRCGNGAFTASDNGKILAVSGATSAANDIEFLIDSPGVVDTEHVTVTPAIPADELMVAATRTWVTSLDRAPSVVGTDSLDYGNKKWTIAAANFVSADVGRLIHITGTTNNNDGFFVIASVDATGDFCTTETVAAGGSSEVFGGTETFRILDVDREILRDLTHDSVNGTNKNWTILGAAFTSADVGRYLRVANAQNAGNNADHLIEEVISSTVIKTSTGTTPVTEDFTGASTFGSLSTLDVVSKGASTAEDTYITGTRHAIASVDSESQITLASDPTNGSGITLNAVVYTITRDLTRTEEATAIAGYTSAFASRRVVHTWPDVLAVSLNSVATKVPGYFAGAAFAGLTAGLPSQAGFTNLTITGFIGRENSDDRFTDTQLDTIANGGSLILTQAVEEAPLAVRHQLTTDTSTIYFQEYSVTKNVDLIARFFRDLYRAYLGIYNITDTLLDVLKTKGEGGLEFLLNARVARVGAPIRRGNLTNIQESATQPDTVEIELDVDVPLPLNNIKVTILV